MKTIKTYLGALGNTVKIGIKYAPINFLFLIMGSLGMAFTFVWQSDAEKKLFDNVFLFTLKENSNKILISFIAFVFAYVCTQIMIHLSNCAEEIIEFKVQKLLSKEICKKASNMNPLLFEDSIFLDKLAKATRGKEASVTLTLCTLALMFFYIPYFILMCSWLFTISPLLVIIIPMAFIPSIIAYIAQIKIYIENEETIAPLSRRLQVYEDSMVGKYSIKETRLLGCLNYFMKLYKDVLFIIAKKEYEIRGKRQKLNIILKLVQASGFILIILLAAVLAINGSISVGAFAAIFSSIDILFSNMNEAVSRQFATISEEFGSVYHYNSFMENGEHDNNYQDKIMITELSNMSFAYPNCKEMILKDISITIEPQQTIAIVGENGAGKSTLAKILMGIYEPTSGTVNKKELEIGKSAVFQNYVNYALTLKENIKISQSGDKVGFQEAVEHIGIENLPNKLEKGWDTLLSKEFGGVDLSGGEWQRVALARGIYRTSDFIMFDEPTSAIDPFEESNMYTKIAEISRDKTAIIITHRMATVQFADRILVLKGGRVVEEGNHQDLLKKGGEYTRLYESQSQNYMDVAMLGGK